MSDTAAGNPSYVGPVLRLDNVHKSFGEAHVLRGIDLAVGEHEVVALIGASGSGKSTLLRTVTPALLNDFVALQKDVGLISVLGALDAVRWAQIESGQRFNFTPYVVAGLLFVLLAVPSARLADHVSARARRRQQSGNLL